MVNRLSASDYQALLRKFRIVAGELITGACEEAERVLNREIEAGRLTTDQAIRCKSLIWTSAERAFEKAVAEVEQYVAAKGGGSDDQ